MNNDDGYNVGDYYTWPTAELQKTWDLSDGDTRVLADTQICCKTDKNKYEEDTICYICIKYPAIFSLPCL